MNKEIENIINMEIRRNELLLNSNWIKINNIIKDVGYKLISKVYYDHTYVHVHLQKLDNIDYDYIFTQVKDPDIIDLNDFYFLRHLEDLIEVSIIRKDDIKKNALIKIHSYLKTTLRKQKIEKILNDLNE